MRQSDDGKRFLHYQPRGQTAACTTSGYISMTNNAWAQYARIQRLAAPSTLNDKAWGIDDALEGILDRIQKGQTVSSNQADNLVTNRTTKYRHRRTTLLPLILPLFVNGQTENVEGRSLARCYLGRCPSQCSPHEWRILLSLGDGETYREIADRHGVPDSTVKTCVRRVRQRLTI